MKKENAEEGKILKWILISLCVAISILLIVLCIFHFYMLFKFVQTIDLFKMEGAKTPSIYIWQAVGATFSAFLDILLLVGFIYLCYIIYCHHVTLLKQNSILKDLNKVSCPNCGEKLEPDVSFCSKCGCKLKEETQQKENDLITQKIKESD